MRKIITVLGLTGAFAMYAVVARAQLNEEQMLGHLLNAYEQRQPAVVLSAKLGEPFNEALAYRVQTQYVKRLLQQRRPLGFKAGLTTAAAQAKFKVAGPVAGALIEPVQPSAKTLTQSAYHRMMIELELGFRLNQAVSERVKSVEALRAMVAEVVPVIELPDLGFDQPKQLTGVDIIASNVAAKYWLTAKGVKPSGVIVNQLPVSLYHNQQLILQGQSGEVMSDQWQALLWLINRMIENGWTIYPGQLLITGAIGKMLPAEPGVYEADFAELGKLEFVIQPQ